MAQSKGQQTREVVDAIEAFASYSFWFTDTAWSCTSGPVPPTLHDRQIQTLMEGCLLEMRLAYLLYHAFADISIDVVSVALLARLGQDGISLGR